VRDYLGLVRKGIAYAVLVVILTFVIYMTGALFLSMLNIFLYPDPSILDKDGVPSFFGSLLLVVIGLELVYTLYGLITESRIQLRPSSSWR
jgi:uncharacterized membrane protein (DUF373 family)